jgi:uncharacterized protein YjiS (DUF1127 family)
MTTLNTVFHHIGERFHAWRERERAIAELAGLDDRMLADIGLRRGDIPYIVLESEAEFLPIGRATPGEPANVNAHGQHAA